MNLLPRSLLGRNALLIVVLIGLGQLGGALLVREMVLKPRLAQIADSVARNVSAVREGLAAIPPESRAAFVDRFNRRTLEDQASKAKAQARFAMLLTPLERSFVRTVSARLAAADGAEALWRRESSGNLSLRLTVEGGDHWIVLPNALPAREFTGAWLAVSVGSALLALIGALWFQRRLNRPLARVVTAARTLAAGQAPTPLPEDGPTEIATVSRSFNHLVDSLQQADRERALMLAGVSHDLRTPLTKLRLGVEILGSAAEPIVTASMARSIEDMDGIVGQFLDFARSGSDEPLAPASLDVLAREIAGVYADHGPALALVLGGTPPAMLRPQAIRRAMTNLIENAWRHGRPPVTFATGVANGALWFEVVDCGDGVDLAQAESLKQPFRRSGSARSGPPGAGLGLAIVQRIVQMHGGRFDLLAAEGRGLRARVQLPMIGVPPPDPST